MQIDTSEMFIIISSALQFANLPYTITIDGDNVAYDDVDDDDGATIPNTVHSTRRQSHQPYQRAYMKYGDSKLKIMYNMLQVLVDCPACIASG